MKNKIFIIISLMAITSLNASVIVAHRGANRIAPENSVEALKLAYERGAKIVEGDFYQTKEGKIICVHGAKEIEKHAGVKKSPVDITSEDLKTLDISKKFPNMSPVRIPTLEEFFAAVPKGKGVFFEIKNYPKGFFEKVEEARKAAKMPVNKLIFISFNKNALADIKSKNPRYKCYWLYDLKKNKDDATLKPTPEEAVKVITDLKLDGIGLGHYNLTEDYYRKYRQLAPNKLFGVWTVNKIEELKKYESWGVDTITTDRIREFMEATSKK